MTTKVIIFTGAPENKDIDWSATTLLSEFQEPILRFAGRDSKQANKNSHKPTPSPAPSYFPDLAAWRSVPQHNANIESGFSQSRSLNIFAGPYEPTLGSSADFLTTASYGDDDGVETNLVLSQFYEHSITIHEGIPSTQLVSQSTEQTTSFLSDGTTSFISTNSGSQLGSLKEPVQFRGSEAIRDLESLPSAKYLAKIEPQTMTCHLIVGIISIPKPRAVQTRWGTKHLVEVLVGDETKAGFSVTFWLPHDTVEKSPLAGLRPQDIVLLQNVALSVFQNKVYGSSLRRDPTKVYLLYRMRLDSSDRGGYYTTADLSASGPTHPQLDKTRRVRDWVLNFVGQAPRVKDKGKTKHETRPRWDMPPADDTQLITHVGRARVPQQGNLSSSNVLYPAMAPDSHSSSFVIARPQPADAARIAAIHLAAMDSNPLLHAQFPTRESLASLERFLEAHTATLLRRGDPTGGILVAREAGERGELEGVIVAFAKWDSPSSSSSDEEQREKLEEDDELQSLEGCRREFLDGYASLAIGARERYFGGRECYSLSFVCTDPSHQGRGAGSLLTRRVLDMAAAEGLPVYLESTEVAVPLYERLGFRELGGFEMRIPRRGTANDTEVYRETCMVWYPPAAEREEGREVKSG
ncbi:hypothetical protein VTJ49DRAFT_3697 [Mycothermus thermophilus]|uniref:N-acetyltransferase domain-containing protein n=1 Tax=Humicola insolens TaxID=85995 RepID=A0ABR3VLZ4_HUMIN